MNTLRHACSTQWHVAAWLLLLTGIVRAPTLFCGYYNPDETCYATIAQRLLEGKWLYVDIVDHKPPLLNVLYLICTHIGGQYAIQVAHAAVILLVAATASMIGLIARALGATFFAALCTASLYVVGASLGPPSDVAAANAELVCNLPIAFAIYGALAAQQCTRHAKRWLVTCGLACGLAILIKLQTAIIPLIIMLILALPWHTNALRNILIVSAATWTPLMLCAGYLHATNRLADAWYWSVTVNAWYIQGHALGWAWIGTALRNSWQMITLAYGGFWFALLVERRAAPRIETPPSSDRLIRWWLFAAIIAIVPGLRFFGHYYLLILPPLCIIGTAAGLRWRARHARARRLPLPPRRAHLQKIARVARTLECLASCWQMSKEECDAITTHNTITAFGLSIP